MTVPPPSSATSREPVGAGRAVPVSTTAPVKSATNAERGAAASSLGVPSWTTRPRSMTPTRSPSCAASAKSCVTSSAGASLSRSRAAELAGRARARARVERGQRLVEQQHLRPPRERARHGHALALPAATACADARRPGPPGRTARAARARARAARARQPAQRIRHVLPRAQVREQRVVLEHVAAAAALRGHVDPALGVEPDRAVRLHAAARRAQQPGGHAQDARLARARGPGQRQALAALDRQLRRRARGRRAASAPRRSARRAHSACQPPSASPRWTSLTDSRIAADTATSTADSASAESKSVEKRS